MYLQALEIIGFKSFAQKTRLVFEPGITAIVGPNGCGKSNISDAIRWVLGEQRPTALRSSAMTDVIFNGTDVHKPLGMAEVSITFADCEEHLGTEYNEVTVSRRVFRDGESRYYINKTPCRLRDIQRLFMDTGIGTTSYSVMAQGQIDAILSSRPEDRRAIFEEASGITRFRADRKEALRKLEQTDANLLRLSDVIRELQRQIGSLQRQAGKARRYKELQAELRKLDCFMIVRRIGEADTRIDALQAETTLFAAAAAALREQVETGEAGVSEARAKLMEAERRIGTALEQAMEAQGRCNQAADAIRINTQRIAEYREWIARDEREIGETQAVRADQERALEACGRQLADLDKDLAGADAALAEARAAYDDARDANATVRDALQKLRAESAESERLHVDLQNRLAAAESSAREGVLRNERLAADKQRLGQAARELAERLDDVEGEVETLDALVDTHADAVASGERRLESLRASLREAEREQAAQQSRIAVEKARIQMLETTPDASGEPSGNALAADPANPLSLPDGAVLGPIASRLSAPKTHRAALEAVLRAWMDAVAVRSLDDAAAVVSRLAGDHGARLFAADAAPPQADLDLPKLLDVVTCPDDFAAAAARLLGGVFIVESLDAIPSPRPAGCTFVTLAGAVAFPNGMVELWKAEGGATNPLARHMLAEDAREELARAEDDLAEADARAESLRNDMAGARQAVQDGRAMLDQSRRASAQKEGERNTLSRDLAQSRQRLADVERDLAKLAADTESATALGRDLARRIAETAESRQRLADAASAKADELKATETRFLDAQTRLTDARLAHASASHRAETARSQHAAGAARIAELDRMIQSRRAGIQSYQDGEARLAAENATHEETLARLEADVEARKANVERLRGARAANQLEADQAERTLQSLRRELDATQERHNQSEVALAQARMRLQGIQDRLMADWHLTIAQLAAEPPPEWGADGEPAPEDTEARIAEIRKKMDDMGPVNLVAIEEYQQIEERHAFLTAQEADLTGAKAKLIELIKDIDKQSTELFRDTFEKANANFQIMFQRLFNGGTAELALMDSEDVLESGIDIVARPPGKKPQTIALLSGGERTMTAVALLFAIYMIKPSPFALLDELDASLDDSNIGRFVTVLKDFLDQSQFIIITHNQHTIAGADILYGVTQEEKGISKIVSMRLKRVGVEEPKAEELPEVAAPPPVRRRKKKKKETVDEHESV
ncbi:MAG: chromosome segregation protein SMC [Kiritimatiellia bacterium]